MPSGTRKTDVRPRDLQATSLRSNPNDTAVYTARVAPSALLRFDQPFEGIHVCQVLRPS